MSWSMKKPADDSDELREFQKAMANAVASGILMFCASGDRGDLEEKDSYPAAYNRSKIIKIGAATDTGRARVSTPDLRELDFIFPGQEVLERRPKGVPLVKIQAHSGSSIATALASGLAALVLHSVRLGAIYNLTTDPKDVKQFKGMVSEAHFTESRSPARATDHMKAAFKAFGLNQNNNKFIEIWQLLDDDHPEIQRNWGGAGPDNREKLKVIEEIATKFVSNRRGARL